jgi:hypothetical protein
MGLALPGSMRLSNSLLSVLTTLAMGASAASAWAQAEAPASPPSAFKPAPRARPSAPEAAPTPEPPPSAVAPNGQYVAPLSQTVQPSYVPQSVALSGPRVLRDWDDGRPVPYGYHEETWFRRGLLTGGLITFGVPYLLSGMVASTVADSAGSGSNTANSLYVPLVGPFLEMGQTSSATGTYFLTIDGLAQLAGAAMIIYAIASPRSVLVRNDLAMVTVSPMRLGKDGSGFGLLGRF